MSAEPTTARRRARDARRYMVLIAMLFAVIPVARADASAAFVPVPNQLWVIDNQDQANSIILEYDATNQRFLISDDAGIQPAANCEPVGDRVACPDPDGLVHEIYVVLKGGDDVFSVGEDPAAAIPPQISETIVGGGEGNDVVVGGPLRDRILGEHGRDVLAGGAGDDKVVGGGGRDGLIGFGGDDLILGGQGADAIFGFGGDDIVHGESGSDTLLGGRGDDRLLGGPKHDLIEAGKGLDVLLGETGPDHLLALDGIRDLRINCGPGAKEKFERDPFDPRARSC